MKEADLKLEGKIIDKTGGGMYKVECTSHSLIALCKKSGKMNKNKITITVGDSVLFVISGLDGNTVKTGRIERRL